jgi:hypothetical protein
MPCNLIAVFVLENHWVSFRYDVIRCSRRATPRTSRSAGPRTDLGNISQRTNLSYNTDSIHLFPSQRKTKSLTSPSLSTITTIGRDPWRRPEERTVGSEDPVLLDYPYEQRQRSAEVHNLVKCQTRTELEPWERVRGGGGGGGDLSRITVGATVSLGGAYADSSAGGKELGLPDRSVEASCEEEICVYASSSGIYSESDVSRILSCWVGSEVLEVSDY